MKELTIDKKNGTVAYNDKYHIYWDTEDLKTYISATTLIGLFEQEFDTEFFLKYKAFERLCNPTKDFLSNLRASKVFDFDVIKRYYPSLKVSELNKTVEEIRSEWKKNNSDACTMGTSIHEGYENMFFKTGKYQLSDYGFKKQDDIFMYEKDCYDIKYKKQALPECLIAMKTQSGVRVAGQIDLLVVHDKWINIFDYKGLDINTPILTTNGFKLMKDITENDIVYDIEGNQAKVMHKSELHKRKRIKITFDNNESIVCDDEHRWLVRIDSKNDEVINANDLYNRFINGHSISIKNPKYIKTNNTKCDINPYMYGAYMAIKFEKRYNHIDEYNCMKNLNKVLFDCKLGMVYSIRSAKLLLEKIVKDDDVNVRSNYMTTSFNDRVKVFNGMIDFLNTTINNDGSILVYMDEKIYDCFIEIASSIGFIIKNHIRTPKYCKVNIVSTNKSVKIHGNNIKTGNICRKIKSMIYIEEGYTQCIEVDSPTHTYLAGTSLIPTHNTNKKLKFESYKDNNGYVMMKEPLNHLMDCNMIHYTLQLSLYSYMVWRLYQQLSVAMPRIIYARDSNAIKFHDVAYLRKEVVDILKYFRDFIIGKSYNYSKIIYKDGRYYIED